MDSEAVSSLRLLKESADDGIITRSEYEELRSLQMQAIKRRLLEAATGDATPNDAPETATGPRAHQPGQQPAAGFPAAVACGVPNTPRSQGACPRAAELPSAGQDVAGPSHSVQQAAAAPLGNGGANPGGPSCTPEPGLNRAAALSDISNSRMERQHGTGVKAGSDAAISSMAVEGTPRQAPPAAPAAAASQARARPRNTQLDGLQPDERAGKKQRMSFQDYDSELDHRAPHEMIRPLQPHGASAALAPSSSGPLAAPAPHPLAAVAAAASPAPPGPSARGPPSAMAPSAPSSSGPLTAPAPQPLEATASPASPRAPSSAPAELARLPPVPEPIKEVQLGSVRLRVQALGGRSIQDIAQSDNEQEVLMQGLKERPVSAVFKLLGVEDPMSFPEYANAEDPMRSVLVTTVYSDGRPPGFEKCRVLRNATVSDLLRKFSLKKPGTMVARAELHPAQAGTATTTAKKPLRPVCLQPNESDWAHWDQGPAYISGAKSTVVVFESSKVLRGSEAPAGRIVVLPYIKVSHPGLYGDYLADRRWVQGGPPLVFHAGKSVLRGGIEASEAVEKAVQSAMEKIQQREAGRAAFPLLALQRCSPEGQGYISQGKPKEFRNSVDPSWHLPLASRTVFLKAIWDGSSRAFGSDGETKGVGWFNDGFWASHMSCFAANEEQDRLANSREKAERMAYGVARGLEAARRGRMLRMWLSLEPDPSGPEEEGASSTGTMVFQVQAWSRSQTEAEVAEAGAQDGRRVGFLEALGRKPCPFPAEALRQLAEASPEGQAFQRELRRWEAAAALDLTVPGFLGLMESGEMEAATQPRGLTVTLRPYQLQALGFMQRAEQGEGGLLRHLGYRVLVQSPDATDGSQRQQQQQQQQSWWWSPFLREAKPQPPAATTWGGFLAETMGLGKTVEVLALILNDRHSNGGPQPTPVSQDTQQPAALPSSDPLAAESERQSKASRRLRSGATLVVCAVSLVGQWMKEAESKSAGSLRIYQYHGPKRIRSPARLAADYDVVLTTYGTLGTDFRRSTSAEAPRWTQEEAPLHKVQWHRVVFDESHSINNSNATSCAALGSVRRWACTGTPLSTSVENLQGQFKALGIDPPYFGAFTGALNARDPLRSRPRSALLFQLMSKVMVRHSKDQVTGGETVLQLPPLHQGTVEVHFSKEEEALYKRAHDQARRRFGELVRSKEKSVHMKAMSMLIPLRRIASGGEMRPESLGLPSSAAAAAAVVPCESKLQALVQELHAMRSCDPAAKALVFSQYSDTLEWLKRRLPGANFQFRALGGDMTLNMRSKAIADFQGDPPTTVFLISTRAAALGINLTAASHVFLLEPALNPALEEQAVGRAWRMGQAREVSVKRMFVKGSVEERIMELKAKRVAEAGGGGGGGAGGSNGSLSSDTPKEFKLAELELLFKAPDFPGPSAAIN